MGKVTVILDFDATPPTETVKKNGNKVPGSDPDIELFVKDADQLEIVANHEFKVVVRSAADTQHPAVPTPKRLFGKDPDKNPRISNPKGVQHSIDFGQVSQDDRPGNSPKDKMGHRYKYTATANVNGKQVQLDPHIIIKN